MAEVNMLAVLYDAKNRATNQYALRYYAHDKIITPKNVNK